MFLSGSLDDFRTLDLDTILNLFGDASTFNVSRSNVSTYGELADCVRNDKVKGSSLMTKGAFKINGIRHDQPNEKINFDSVILSENLSLICWGKRKFSLVRWV